MRVFNPQIKTYGLTSGLWSQWRTLGICISRKRWALRLSNSYPTHPPQYIFQEHSVSNNEEENGKPRIQGEEMELATVLCFKASANCCNACIPSSASSSLSYKSRALPAHALGLRLHGYGFRVYNPLLDLSGPIWLFPIRPAGRQRPILIIFTVYFLH